MTLQPSSKRAVGASWSDSLVLAGILAAAAAGPVMGADGTCSPHWSDAFPSGGGDTDHHVRALARVEQPSGPVLYAGGSFSVAGDVEASGIAKWNGQEWSALGTGVEGLHATLVVTIAAFDNGAGQEIYAGGFITEAGGEPVSNIARWDGESWSSVGSGVDGVVTELYVHDDGTGPALYVGGGFTEAGGKPISHIARWDGEVWTGMDGPNGLVWAMTSFDIGGETQLIVAGNFSHAGGVEAQNIARWDGAQWHAMGEGFDDTVYSITIIDDESGPTVVAGGRFSHSGDTAVHRVAQWNGQSWVSLGHPSTSGSFLSLAFGDIGDGPTLYAGSSAFIDGQSTRVARWTSESWQALGVGVLGPVRALTIYPEETSPMLYAGGSFMDSGNFQGILRWTGEYWLLPGRALRAPSGYGTFTAAYFDDGNDEHLYVGGGFESAGDTGQTPLARWDGEHWSSIGTFAGPSSSFNPAYTIKTSDVGGVPSLYIGGSFTAIDGQPVNRIASWDGTNWQALGSGVADGDSWASAFAIAEFDDGRGPRLIVGGQFTTAGGLVASNIAAWDGVNWHALGSGTNGTVNHMVVFDDGSGPSLYVSGQFTMAGGVYAGGLARWDGSEWHSVGSITASWWNHAPLAVHDDKLIVGDTVTIGDVAHYGPVAVFDGESWTDWSDGYAGFPGWLATFDDGTGPALYSGVSVQQGAEESMRALLKWDGLQWIVPDVGGVGFVDGEEQSYIIAMAVSSDGERLAVGGRFSSAGDTLSPHVAILTGCPAQTPGDINGDGIVDSLDLLLLLDAWGPCPDPARNDCPADLNGDSVVDGMDLLILLANWG